MKRVLALFSLLAFAVSLAAQTAQQPASTTKTDVPAPPAADTKGKTAGPKVQAVSPAKPVPKNKEEPEPKIPGTVIPRGNGTFLSLTVEGGYFKLSFYDAKKKVMAPDVTRASVRWPNTRGPGDNRTMLNRAGDALAGNKVVLQPFNFNAYLTLLSGEGDNVQAVESYVVKFNP